MPMPLTVPAGLPGEAGMLIELRRALAGRGLHGQHHRAWSLYADFTHCRASTFGMAHERCETSVVMQTCKTN